MAVRGTPATIGMFEEGSHKMIECLDNPSHVPSLNVALQAVKRSVDRTEGLQGYDDKTGTGDLKYVVARTAPPANRVELTLVWNGWDGLLAPRGTKTQVEAMTLAREKAQKTPEYKRKQRQRSKDIDEAVQRFLTQLLNDKQAKRWHSIWLHVHDGDPHTCSVFSFAKDSWRLLHGQQLLMQSLTELGAPKLATPVLHFLPSVFRQANCDGFTKIIKSIRTLLQPTAEQQEDAPSSSTSSSPRRLLLPKVVELYGGVGTIGLNLIDLVSSLVCSDENPNNVACFAAAVKSLPTDIASRARYEPLNAADMVLKGKAFDTPCDWLIVDPPRKGLDQEVLAALAQPCRFHSAKPGSCTYRSGCKQSHIDQANLPSNVIYVSCGFKALQRDLITLSKEGWSIAHVEGHILFPGSDHLETLVHLTRAPRGKQAFRWGR